MSAGDNFIQFGTFLTPPPRWKSNRNAPEMPRSAKADYFHVIHKVPAGDSPYVRAKHVQLVDKDPNRAIALFWSAINSGDRVDSALKDMAVVMKQLDRSDEAIEAIKSFRQLCPLESQESLDNVLLELYKKSCRYEEEIQILQVKLKHIEEGTAFGGKRTKMARSYGKKIQLTIEKEYSRLLGNLAWAYMQQRDYKSAEEHYRKALSLELDRNKQCNLAICLMHLNKMTEAKFLLGTVRASFENAQMDESSSRSFERAAQMLDEFESGNLLNLQKCHNGNTDTSGTNRGNLKATAFDSRMKGKNWVSTDQKEEAFGRNKAYNSPFTQPRRCLWSGNNSNQRRGQCTEASIRSCTRRLLFQQHTNSESEHHNLEKNDELKSATGDECNLPSRLLITGDCTRLNSFDTDCEQNSASTTAHSVRSTEAVENDDQILLSQQLKTNLGNLLGFSESSRRKSWAEMVEEDEQELLNERNAHRNWVFLPNKTPDKYFDEWETRKEFADENINSNIILETPRLLNQSESLSKNIESFALKDSYYMQPIYASSSMNQEVTQSLCFDQHQNLEKEENCVSSPLQKRAFDFETSGSVTSEEEDILLKCSKLLPRTRLQVFQDITPDSP